MMGSLGAGELIAILFVLLLLFGAKRLPALGKGLGEGFTNFRRSLFSKGEDLSTTRHPFAELPPTADTLSSQSKFHSHGLEAGGQMRNDMGDE